MHDEHHSKATLRPCDCTCICGDDRDVERGIAEPCEARKASEALTAKAVERSERIAALIKAGGYKPGFDLLDALEALSSSQASLAECSAVKDGAYLERNQVVAALAKCYPSGIALTPIEGWSPEWFGCVYIDLPTGQASWHFHTSHTHLFTDLPPYTGTWDGHSTPEKYERLAKLAKQAPQQTDPDGIDPHTHIDMLKSWLTEADASSRALQQHLNAVLEIAETWRPDYATQMDKDTLRYAREGLPPVGSSLTIQATPI